jgi:chemotaxis response regulator CheB
MDGDMKIGVASYTPEIMSYVADAVRGSETMRITWMSSDYRELHDLLVQSPADIVLMCVAFLDHGGVGVVEEISRDLRTPILVLARDSEQHDELITEAMSYGAAGLAVLSGGGTDKGAERADFLRTIGRFVRNKAKAAAPTVVNPQEQARILRTDAYLVAIGASAGGPQALLELLSEVQADHTGACFVIAQHLDKEFVPRFVTWLGQNLGLEVKLIEEGERLRSGVVYLGNGEKHVQMARGGRLTYMNAAASDAYCPSVDVLFDSVIDNASMPACGLLLSGMGEDGAQGLLRMRQAGLFTLAQSARSASVNGMPNAAVKLDAASKVVAAAEMAEILRNQFESVDEQDANK